VWDSIKRLTLGLLLIIAASTVLLMTDTSRRRTSTSRDGAGRDLRSASELRRTSESASKTWRIEMLEFVDVPDSEDAQRGVRDGLKQSGLALERDYTLDLRNAQGDMPTLTALADAALSSGADLLITLSTPTLQATLQRARNVPIVFTFSSDPIGAGAGRSNDDHLPNVTGVPTLAPYEELAEIVLQCVPNAKRLGALLVPAEVNSVYNTKMMAQAAKQRGMELVTLPVNTSTEIADAALSLCTRDIDAIVQVGSNLTTVAFASIAHAAVRAQLPLFGTLTSNIHEGAAIAVARDYYEGGVRAGHLAARIIRGESPATIPFEPLTVTRVLVNPEAARKQGLEVPEPVLQRADEVVKHE
jgi:ABC-type uncharacterized transport system substrate-binding protein